MPNTIGSLVYSDVSPWPSGTDGEGRSLVFTGRDANWPGSWRASLDPGGNPGVSDRVAWSEGQDLISYALNGEAALTVTSEAIDLRVELNPGSDHAFELSDQFSGDNGRADKVWNLDRSEAEVRRFFRLHLLR